MLQNTYVKRTDVSEGPIVHEGIKRSGEEYNNISLCYFDYIALRITISGQGRDLLLYFLRFIGGQYETEVGYAASCPSGCSYQCLL